MKKSLRQIAGLHVTKSEFGYRGIEWCPDKARFRARIGKHRGRQQYLGLFKTAEEAATAYDSAARLEYGEHAAINFPVNGERRVLRSQLAQGFCPQGHSLNVFGYFTPKGRGPNCRKCNAAAQARYKARKKATARERSP